MSETHRICPVCGGKFPPLLNPNYRIAKTARPVWTCSKCYQKERRDSGASNKHKHYKQRTPGAITGPGAKESTPETKARIKALFDRDPLAVIHRLCDLLEGMHGDRLSILSKMQKAVSPGNLQKRTG